MSGVEGSAARARGVMLALGLGYLALAVAGIATVGWDEFGFGEPVRMLGFLGVSTLLCVVHGLLGVVLAVAAWRRAAAAIAPVAVVTFVAMAAFGTVAKFADGSGDPLNLNWWNIGLYVLSAVACGYTFALRVWALRHPPGPPRHRHRRTTLPT